MPLKINPSSSVFIVSSCAFSIYTIALKYSYFCHYVGQSVLYVMHTWATMSLSILDSQGRGFTQQ